MKNIDILFKEQTQEYLINNIKAKETETMIVGKIVKLKNGCKGKVAYQTESGEFALMQNIGGQITQYFRYEDIVEFNLKDRNEK